MTLAAPNNNPISISHETVRGTFWAYLSFFGGKLLNFVTTMLLARLLVPEQFGLVGYCTIAIQYLDILNTAGINSALIARRDKIEPAANAAFFSYIGLGIISYIVAWYSAPDIAGFFNAPEVADLFRVLALFLPINGLGQVPGALLQRDLKFHKKIIPDLIRNLIKGLVAIVLAYLGYGPWSLIWGQLVGEATAVVFSWILAGWLPSPNFDRKVSLEVLNFGAHVIVIELAGALRNNVDYILVGRMLGATALGLYTMAYRIPELIIRSFNNVIGKVIFPILSKVQSDIGQLRSIYFVYIRYIALITFALGFGLALVSFSFVQIFFEAEWQTVAQPMLLISIALAISSIGYVPGVLYKVIHKPEILGRLTLSKLPFLVVVLVYCAQWGIVGISIGQVVFAIFSLALDCLVVKRVVDFSLMDTLRAVWPALIATISMVVGVFAYQAIFSWDGLVDFVITSLVGAMGYLAGIAVADRNILAQSYATLRQVIPGKNS